MFHGLIRMILQETMDFNDGLRPRLVKSFKRGQKASNNH
jgi:hypothetical protein